MRVTHGRIGERIRSTLECQTTMHDADIRDSLASFLINVHANETNTIIRHEFGVCAGVRRVDLAVLNGEIVGYEIKSDEDTLNRLVGQVEFYGRVLDRAVLVTTERHLERSMKVLPGWWGVMVASIDDLGVRLETIRQSLGNSTIDPFSVSQLLWRDEAMLILKTRGLARGLSGKARHYLWIALIEAFDTEELKHLVRETIKARPEWQADPRHEQGASMYRTRAIPSLAPRLLDSPNTEVLQRHPRNNFLH